MTPTNMTRRRLLGTAAAGSAVLAMTHIVRAQSYKSEYKLSVTTSRPNQLVESAYRWAGYVQERTNGRINIKVYEQSQLVGGASAREVSAMRSGVIDFLVASSINLSTSVKQMNLFALPFLLPTNSSWDAVLAAVRGDLETLMNAQEATSLAWAQSGYRQLCNSKREIRKPADMQGLKIRFAASQIYQDIFTALGANPVQMSFADLLPALSTGAVDGLETPFDTFLDNKMYTLGVKHMSVWNYSTDGHLFALNTGVWKSFTPADQQIVRAAAEQAAKEQTMLYRKTMQEGGTVNAIKSHGVTVADLTDSEIAEFRRVTGPVTDKWANELGVDFVNKARAAASKA